MAKYKNKQAIWTTRIKKNTSSLFQKVGNSIDIDKRLYKEDIQGSIAHVEMLFKQKIISFKIKNKIIYGLTKIDKEITNNKFEFDKKYEDIHMNIEKRLFQIIGEEAGYIHTARSRNDQVITDFKIWTRSSSKEINNSIDKVMKSIINLAEKNIETIMPGFTHLKNAQAISFAHYLMAYIEIFKRDKKRFNNNLDNLNENPLGVAALSGTTIEIPTIDGGKAKIKIPDGTQNGKQFRLKGKGMPFMRRGDFGDLYVQVKTEVPVYLNKKQKELLEQFREIENDKSNPSIKKFFQKAKDFWKN